MTIKRKIHIIIDFIMVIALPVLMAYELIGAKFHEWAGSFMFLLFIVHNMLNYKWYKSVFKGKYTLHRVMCVVINISLFIIMISLMFSGVVLSRYTFSFLNISFGKAFARTVHLLGAYWGYVLMSIHIGFHFNAMIKAITIPNNISKILRILFFVVFIYGIYAFEVRKIGSYMFLQNQFVFFDFSESVFKFISDYIAIMIAFAGLGHYIALITKKSVK